MQRSFLVLVAILVTGVAVAYHATERPSQARACACRESKDAVLTVYAVRDLLVDGATEHTLSAAVARDLETCSRSCAAIDTRPGAIVVTAPPRVQREIRAALRMVRAEMTLTR